MADGERSMKFSHKPNNRWFIYFIALSMGLGGYQTSGAPFLDVTKSDILKHDRDGDGQADPGDTITYTVIITNSGKMDGSNVLFKDIVDLNTTLLPESIKTTPVARNDFYQATGNVLIEVAAPGVLVNDIDPDGGDVKAVKILDGASANGGLINLNSNGSFTYNPPVGFNGNDFFNYSIVDTDESTSSANVVIIVQDMIWFVDESTVCPCDGRLTSPYDDLAFTADSFDENAVNNPGDVIYVHEGLYNGGLTLLNNQRLIGSGSSGDLATVSGITLAPDSAPLPIFTDIDPVITSNNEGIILGANNTIRGLTIGDTFGTGISGNAVGTLTIQETSINGEGGGIHISDGTLDVILDGLRSSSDTDSGIVLSNVTGLFSVIDSSSFIKTVNAPAVFIEGAPGGLGVNATFFSVFSGDSSNVGFILSSLAAGSTFRIESLEIISSNSNAVLLRSNPGSEISFNNLDINLVTTNQPGLVATHSGTLNVGGGVIDTGSGRSVQLVNTDLIISLTSATSIGGSTPGIELLNTTGSFVVTGDGTAGSGGTISNKTGADGTNNGIGIQLVNATNVSLSNMQLNDFDNFAIDGTNVTNFELINSTISGSSGNSTLADEGCIDFENLLGGAKFLNNMIGGGVENNLSIRNNSGELNLLTIDGGTIGLNHSTFGNDAVFVESRNNATINTTITNVHFLGARGDLIQTNALDDSSMNIVIRDNVFENTHPNIVPGGGGITLSGGSIGGVYNVTYEISGTSFGTQSFRDAKGNAITANFLYGLGNVNGTIQNNLIGVSGLGGSASSGGSGILVGSGGSVIHSVLINNNDIHGVNGFAGIDIHAAGQSILRNTITKNSVDEFGGFAFAGLYQMVGPNGSDIAEICSNIHDNTFDSSGVSFTSAVFYDQISASAHYNFPGYTGSPHGENIGGAASTDLESYLLLNNNSLSAGAGASYVVDASFTRNITGNGSDCPLPAMLSMASEIDAMNDPVLLSTVQQIVSTTPGEQYLQAINDYYVRQDSDTLPDRIDLSEPFEKSLSEVNVVREHKPLTDKISLAQGIVASGEDFSIEIGTLPSGVGVTITFDVMIDRPPPLFAIVCNQGLVFSDTLVFVTDDPDTSTNDDPTCTNIDLAGDADEDEDVDWDDYALFNACMSGPDIVPMPENFFTSEKCLNYFDFDFDQDVDLDDYSIFNQIFLGL